MAEPVATNSEAGSKFVEVKCARMHYLEQGEGRPILFLHGNPTSSYLWRNVIPHVAPHGHCIALDLIGMGRSDKPDIEYRFDDNANYLEEFIDALELKDITLVVHDWGAGLGLDYACRHPDNVRGVVFMEGVYRPLSWKERPIIERFMFKRMRDPKKGYKMIVENNFFIERVLPMMVVRKLSADEMAAYREPFSRPEFRKPVQMWPRQIPFDGDPPEVHQRIEAANVREAPMGETGVKRKLAVTLVADVEGYSRLMGADEEATLKPGSPVARAGLSGHRASRRPMAPHRNE